MHFFVYTEIERDLLMAGSDIYICVCVCVCVWREKSMKLVCYWFTSWWYYLYID